jgi:hypothetical protein
MNLNNQDPRTVALGLARGRIVAGLVLLVLPNLVLRNWVKESTAETKAIARMMGARDLVLGLGTLTAVKEETQDAEWLSMGAAADAVDALVSAFHPGISKRGRLVTLVGGSAAVVGITLARQFADERSAVAPPS